MIYNMKKKQAHKARRCDSYTIEWLKIIAVLLNMTARTAWNSS